jgi:predicted ATPase
MADAHDFNPRFVLTGGPGVGKSTVIEVLRTGGSRCFDDAARAIIRERRAVGLPPRPAPGAFALEILRREVAAWDAAPLDVGPVFHERGVVDALAMAQGAGALADQEIIDALARHPYRSPVFLFPPWREIFVQDGERDQDFAHVERVHEGVRRYYEQVGYRIVEVPRGPVEARAAFVMGHALDALEAGD